MNDERRALQSALSAALGASVSLRDASGGRAETPQGPVFVKSGGTSAYERFAAEAAGLQALQSARAVRTPAVLACDRYEHGAFIALEWLDLHAPSPNAERRFGEQLAQQHRVTNAQFGWERDNTIGLTKQCNTRDADWVAFYRERRLRYQLALVERNGAGATLVERGERLCEALPAFFRTHRPTPSLLHGDLWSGNWGVDAGGAPVVFDPAVYYGDREADIAMTRLFGGFGATFYAAYHSAWPLDPDANARTALYNLYHVLNHFNLFGGGYLGQAQSMIERLLAEVKG